MKCYCYAIGHLYLGIVIANTAADAEAKLRLKYPKHLKMIHVTEDDAIKFEQDGVAELAFNF